MTAAGQIIHNGGGSKQKVTDCIVAAGSFAAFDRQFGPSEVRTAPVNGRDPEERF